MLVLSGPFGCWALLLLPFCDCDCEGNLSTPLWLLCPVCARSGCLGWPLASWDPCRSPSISPLWLVMAREGPRDTPHESSTMPFCTMMTWT